MKRVGLILIASFALITCLAGIDYHARQKQTLATNQTELNQAQQEAIRCSQFSEANAPIKTHDACRLALQLNDNLIEPHLILAKLYLSTNQIGYAVTHLEQAFKKSAPNSRQRFWTYVYFSEIALIKNQSQQQQTFRLKAERLAKSQGKPEWLALAFN